jgi:DNA-binding transcriptional MerR regulator
MKNLVPIGRFSKVCRLTIKALRHYDELGLLRPALVDEASGYRYYTLAQAAEAERVRALRAVDMPLDEIRALLEASSAERALCILDGHRRRLEEREAATRAALERVAEMIHRKEAVMTYEVSVKSLAAQPTLSVRTTTPLARIGEVSRAAYTEMYAYLGQIGVRPAGPPMAVYHDEALEEEALDVELCVPTHKRVAGKGRMSGGELPAASAACTLHAGSYERVSEAYRALAEWIQAHGHEIGGPPREVHVVSPAQTPDEGAWRTEIAWPIR